MIFILDFRRSAGALIGLAIGDALGAPLEGLAPREKLVVNMEHGGIHGVTRGHFTDDTLQAMAVAASLIHCRGYDPADMAGRLLRGYTDAPWFYGPTSSAVFALVARGVEATRAARMAYLLHGAGRSNGCVMRGAPIGIFFPPSRVRTVSRAASRLTHYDPAAGECSAFVNHMISELCRGADLPAAQRRALAATTHPGVAAMLMRPERHPLAPSLDALLATHCAVSVAAGSSSFEEAVVRGVNLGGDADTVGALCGAIAGAAFGIEAIPKRWLAQLHRREELFLLAGRLTAASVAAGTG